MSDKVLARNQASNVALTDLLHAELDRALPGKREAMANRDPQSFWRAVGITPPRDDPEADAWARGVIGSLRDDAGRSAA